jgi:hypothetical protein
VNTNSNATAAKDAKASKSTKALNDPFSTPLTSDWLRPSNFAHIKSEQLHTPSSSLDAKVLPSADSLAVSAASAASTSEDHEHPSQAMLSIGEKAAWVERLSQHKEDPSQKHVPPLPQKLVSLLSTKVEEFESPSADSSDIDALLTDI